MTPQDQAARFIYQCAHDIAKGNTTILVPGMEHKPVALDHADYRAFAFAAFHPDVPEPGHEFNKVVRAVSWLVRLQQGLIDPVDVPWAGEPTYESAHAQIAWFVGMALFTPVWGGGVRPCLRCVTDPSAVSGRAVPLPVVSGDRCVECVRVVFANVVDFPEVAS